MNNRHRHALFSSSPLGRRFGFAFFTGLWDRENARVALRHRARRRWRSLPALVPRK